MSRREPKPGIASASARGIGAALHTAFGPVRQLKTAYPPELDAQAAFDALLERLRNAPGSGEVGGKQ